MTPASSAYVTQYLREHDRDRYLTTLILPRAARSAVSALLAFNAEIAAVSDRVTQPAAGEIRLRWWADALDGAGHGNVQGNPLAEALLSVVAEYGLPTPALTRMIEARRFDLYQDPMPDLTTFEGYAGETVSAAYQLAAMILNGGRPVETGDAAGHLGVAHALTGHLRAFGYNASRGRIFLPWETFAICGVADREVLSGRSGPGIAVALTRLRDLAGDHLRKAARAIALLPKNLRPAFASLAMLRLQLQRLDVDSPFRPPADVADWRKIAAVAWWRLRNN